MATGVMKSGEVMESGEVFDTVLPSGRSSRHVGEIPDPPPVVLVGSTTTREEDGVVRVVLHSYVLLSALSDALWTACRREIGLPERPRRR